MIEAIGGLGLFLLGMIIMTEGLRSLAGHAIRSALLRFTHTPLSGAITGAVTTAILQSSSATTVAAVGFVGAGIMTFPAALGIIFGANIGTTITGWLVVLVGFKLKLGTLLLPVILLGAILKLFGTERLSRIGYTLAGFGLIFIGINYLQSGMGELQAYFTPAAFSADTLSSKLKLLLLGVMFTVITQSSSAGVATTLSALFAGAIQFEQAVALVIGMDVGTTITAAIATIGGSVESKRTGFSHVIYNIFTAMGALLLINPYIALCNWIDGDLISHNAEIVLVAYHSLFNILGVLVVLPFAPRFAHLMEYLFPDKGTSYTQNLDRALLQEPAIAITTSQSSVFSIFSDLLLYINHLLGEQGRGNRPNLVKIQRAIDDAQIYIDDIHLDNDKNIEHVQLIALIHTLDHMQRLARRCHETRRTSTIQNYHELQGERLELITCNNAIIKDIADGNWDEVRLQAQHCSQQIESQVLVTRKTIIENVATGRFDVIRANEYLEAIRWLDRVSDHIERISYHMSSEENRGARL